MLLNQIIVAWQMCKFPLKGKRLEDIEQKYMANFQMMVELDARESGSFVASYESLICIFCLSIFGISVPFVYH